MTRTRGLTSSVRWIDRFQLWIDRFQLWMSDHTPYDGLTLSVLDLHNDSDALLVRVKDALALLERYDPRRPQLKRDPLGRSPWRVNDPHAGVDVLCPMD